MSTTTTNFRTLSEAIIRDHEEIFSTYDQYMKATSSGDADAQDRWAHELTWEIARHSVGEEIVVYPLFGQFMGNAGVKMAAQDRADHQLIKERLAQLEKMKIGTGVYNALLAETIKSLREHVQSEEQHDLPALETHLAGGGASAGYAREFRRTKMFVPTRPHPGAPDQPPWESLAGFLAAPIDKLKDAFSKFPTKEMKEQRAL